MNNQHETDERSRRKMHPALESDEPTGMQKMFDACPRCNAHKWVVEYQAWMIAGADLRLHDGGSYTLERMDTPNEQDTSDVSVYCGGCNFDPANPHADEEE